MATLELSGRQLAVLDEHALATFPEECCGVMVGRAGRVDAVVPTANSHPGPRTTGYTITSHQLLEIYRAIRGSDRRLLGFYHSHPRRNAMPSASDRASASPGLSYLILAVDIHRVIERRCWKLNLDSGQFIEEEILRGSQT